MILFFIIIFAILAFSMHDVWTAKRALYQGSTFILCTIFLYGIIVLLFNFKHLHLFY